MKILAVCSFADIVYGKITSELFLFNFQTIIMQSI